MEELFDSRPTAVMALQSDSRAKGVLSKLWYCDKNSRNNREFEDWSKMDKNDSLTKYCWGEIQGSEVCLMVAREPRKALNQLGMVPKEVILVLGNETRGPGEISLNSEDIHVKLVHPEFSLIKEFPNRVGIYKESKVTLRRAANLIAGVLFKE